MKTRIYTVAIGLLASALAVLGSACAGGASPAGGARPAGGATTAQATTTPLPNAPQAQSDVTAGMTTDRLQGNDSAWKITTYDLIEPYAVPTSPVTPPKLLVFLPGSLSQGCQYKKILEEAAAIGYYAVGISYPNGATQLADKTICPALEVGRTLTVICGNNIHNVSKKSYDCYEQLRHNRFDGTPEANGVKPAGSACDPKNPPPCDTAQHPEGCFCDDYQIGRAPNPSDPTKSVAAEGIENRIYQLLFYLGNCDGHVNQRAAHGPWCGFIDTTTRKPLYNKSLVLAGHSQGGGEAAFIAKIRAVSGVAMFSSPEDAAVKEPATNCVSTPQADGCLVTGSADWLHDGSEFKTPLSHFYALTHEQDEVIPRIEAAWDVLTSIDSTGAHHLIDYPVSCVDHKAGALEPEKIKWSADPNVALDAAPCSNAGPAGPAFHQGQRLYMNTAPIGLVTPYHDSTVLDAQTPKCSTGSHPLLMPAWRVMLLGAGRLNKSGVPTTCGG